VIKWLVVLLVIWAAWQLLKRPPRARPLAGGKAEARAILGVEAGADAATIRAAHRRLVTGVHPDRGGSAELTRRVNAARDLLLGDGGTTRP
jgi:DnaJ family protein C protein 19